MKKKTNKFYLIVGDAAIKAYAEHCKSGNHVNFELLPFQKRDIRKGLRVIEMPEDATFMEIVRRTLTYISGQQDAAEITKEEFDLFHKFPTK